MGFPPNSSKPLGRFLGRLWACVYSGPWCLLLRPTNEGQLNPDRSLCSISWNQCQDVTYFCFPYLYFFFPCDCPETGEREVSSQASNSCPMACSSFRPPCAWPLSYLMRNTWMLQLSFGSYSKKIVFHFGLNQGHTFSADLKSSCSNNSCMANHVWSRGFPKWKAWRLKLDAIDNQPHKAGKGVFEQGLNALVFIN